MLNGHVAPGDVVAVVGAGPIGLAAITGARLYSPSHMVAIDPASSRAMPRSSSAPTSSSTRTSKIPSMWWASLTDGLGADVSMEAVGTPRRSS